MSIGSDSDLELGEEDSILIAAGAAAGGAAVSSSEIKDAFVDPIDRPAELGLYGGPEQLAEPFLQRDTFVDPIDRPAELGLDDAPLPGMFDDGLVLRAAGELVDNYFWPHRAHINAEL